MRSATEVEFLRIAFNREFRWLRPRRNALCGFRQTVEPWAAVFPDGKKSINPMPGLHLVLIGRGDYRGAGADLGPNWMQRLRASGIQLAVAATDQLRCRRCADCRQLMTTPCPASRSISLDQRHGSIHNTIAETGKLAGAAPRPKAAATACMMVPSDDQRMAGHCGPPLKSTTTSAVGKPVTMLAFFPRHPHFAIDEIRGHGNPWKAAPHKEAGKNKKSAHCITDLTTKIDLQTYRTAFFAVWGKNKKNPKKISQRNWTNRSWASAMRPIIRPFGR